MKCVAPKEFARSLVPEIAMKHDKYLGWAFVTLGCGLVFLLVRSSVILNQERDVMVKASWRKSVGQVTSLSFHDAKKAYNRYWIIRLRYDVNGEPIESQTVTHSEPHEGQEIQIYYDPEKPTRITLAWKIESDQSSLLPWLSAGACVFLAVSALNWFLYFRGRARWKSTQKSPQPPPGL